MRRAKERNAIRRLPLPPFDDNYCSVVVVVVWFVLLVALVAAVVYLAAVGAVMGGPIYLYHEEGKGDDSSSSDSPVIEHLAPTRRASDRGDDGNYRDEALFPDFLYEPVGGGGGGGSGGGGGVFVPPPRVVEFYAPWCSHCQHYAPQYKKLASEVTATHPDVKFYAVSCVAHQDLCKAQNVHGYPTVKFFKKGSYESTTGTKRKADEILKELGYELVDHDEVDETQPERVHDRGGVHHKSNENDREIARVVPFQRHDVHDAWSDASLSFEFALKNGIYVENGPLSEEKAAALLEWLELLSKSLPSQMGRARVVVDALLENFDDATRGQSHLDGLVSVHVPSKPSWSWRTCTYGDGEIGYTCGLWQLFHVVSVGVVEYNRHNAPIPTRHASETLRNYIEHFFQCDVCRMNFLSMYDTCALDGCHRLSENPSPSEREWRELPLWLWETHNDVNVRLLGERLEQNELEKPSPWESQQARWPSLSSCPNCWRHDRSWDESEVFEHLQGSYWLGNPTYIKIQSDGGGVGGDGPRASAFRWKLSAIVFAAVGLAMRLSRSRKGRRGSGKRK